MLLWCVGLAHKTQTEPSSAQTELLQPHHRPQLTFPPTPTSGARPDTMLTAHYQETTLLVFISRHFRSEERWDGRHRFSIREHRTWPHHLHFSAREISIYGGGGGGSGVESGCWRPSLQQWGEKLCAVCILQFLHIRDFLLYSVRNMWATPTTTITITG